jgi:Family of unknown function (DUF5302)
MRSMPSKDKPAAHGDPPAVPAAAQSAKGTTSAGQPASSEDDELRRAYREALERKHGDGPHGRTGHTGPKPPAPASNDKRQRTFRRKSG